MADAAAVVVELDADLVVVAGSGSEVIVDRCTEARLYPYLRWPPAVSTLQPPVSPPCENLVLN